MPTLPVAGCQSRRCRMVVYPSSRRTWEAPGLAEMTVTPCPRRARNSASSLMKRSAPRRTHGQFVGFVMAILIDDLNPDWVLEEHGPKPHAARGQQEEGSQIPWQIEERSNELERPPESGRPFEGP